ncbi:MAG: rod shape-determining protein MreC [Cyanophyceae cyanobacterium]
MFFVRRWWERHGLTLVMSGLAFGAVWLLYQTQGAAVWELYSSLFRLQPEQEPVLERLTDARILELEQQIAELQSQNQKLQKLLGYAREQPAAIAAPTIGRSVDSWWRQVTVGRGRQDGIQQGAAVSGIGGLVGRVVQVTPHTSRVLLASDPTHRVGVTVSRSRQPGFMEGQSSQVARLEFFEKDPDVRPGDTIVTSSLSRLYPSGLPIGQVKSIDLESGPAPVALVELSAPLDDLEWVLVHPLAWEISPARKSNR